jgi:hypothetical protein
MSNLKTPSIYEILKRRLFMNEGLWKYWCNNNESWGRKASKKIVSEPICLLQISRIINPFQCNYSANRILPSSCLFRAVKRLVDYL